MDWEESQPRRAFGVPPDPEKEWEEYVQWMKEWLKREVRRGDKWFLITNNYWENLQYYLGDKNKIPGAVDVTGIVDKDGDMLDVPASDGNFKVIHEKVWTHLSQKFGIKDNLSPIPRQVVDHEELGKDVIERKLLRVFLAHSKDSSRKEWVPWLISRGDRVFEVEHHLRKCFNINRTHEIRMWHLWDEETMMWEPFLSKFDRPADLYNLYETNRSIVYRVEPINDDRTWPLSLPRDPSLPKERIGNSLRYMWGYGFGKSHDMGKVADIMHRGLAGLQNVENCCYMNCVIQILAQIPSLRDYILTDTYINELNHNNPLSKNGDFAKEFGNLIKHMWSQKYTDIIPGTFKASMAKHNNVYQAYGLHDAHEFLMYLLDGLHEDCNRIKKKPYIELDTDGKSDEVAANETWDAYKQRNESVVIDLFHYLTKSTLECPKCNKTSVTFEPQFGLSLPVPFVIRDSVPLTFIYNNPSRKPLRLRVIMLINSNWNNYRNQVSRITGVPVQSIICGKMVIQRTWEEFFDSSYHIKDHVKGEYSKLPPLSMEKPEPHDGNYKVMMIEIYPLPADYNKTLVNWKDGAPFYFHLPFFLNLYKDIRYDELYDMIYKRIKNRLPEPKQNWWDWKSPEDDEEEERVAMSFKSNRMNYIKPDLSNDTNVWEKKGKRYLFRIYNKVKDFCYPNNNEEMKYLNYGRIGILFHPKYARDYIVPLFNPDNYVKNQSEDHKSYVKPIPKDIVTIDECLTEFHKSEKLEGGNHWYCNKCKEHQLPTKSLSIWSMPDYLSLTLKRFAFNAETNDNKKITTIVKFPVEGLDMDPYIANPSHVKGSAIYDLIGLVNHTGSLSKGHYTTFVKHSEDDYWYYFDDEKATPGFPELLETRQAYMLMYKKRGTTNLTFTTPPEGVTEPFITVIPSAVRDQEMEDRDSSMYGNRPRNKGVFQRANPAKGRLYDQFDPTRIYYDPKLDD